MLSLATPLGVKIIWQENDTFCGPACAQMILTHISGTPNTLMEGAKDDFQTELYCDLCHDNMNSQLWTTPTGLETTIQKRIIDGSNVKSSYLLHCRDTEPRLSRAICWSLLAHHVPAAVLTVGDDHWMVVVDCTVSDVPASIDDPDYTIESFEIHDPYTYTSEKSNLNRVSRFTTYESWVNTCLNAPVNLDLHDGATCNGFVAIIDGKSEATGEYLNNLSEHSPDNTFKIEAEDAEAAAYKFLAEIHFPAHNPWTSLPDDLFAMPPLPIDQPFSVDQFVYLVPFTTPEDFGDEDSGKHVPLVMIIAAEQGNAFILRDAIAAEVTTNGNSIYGSTYLADDIDLLDPYGRGKVVQRFEQFGFRFDRNLIRYFLPTDAILQENLWWRPCRESYSNFLPFYRFWVPTRERYVYVRLDGRVFYELHDSDNNVLAHSNPSAPLASRDRYTRFEFREMKRGSRPIPR